MKNLSKFIKLYCFQARFASFLILSNEIAGNIRVYIKNEGDY